MAKHSWGKPIGELNAEKVNVDGDELREWYARGHSIASIARRFGLTHRKVQWACKHQKPQRATCLFCRQPMPITEGGRRKKFCDHICSGRHRRGLNPDAKCHVCGKALWNGRGDMPRRYKKYCSQRCNTLAWQRRHSQ